MSRTIKKYTKPNALRLLNMLEEKIIVFDGAMGTMIQQQDQVEDYAERKKMTLVETERWLSPILGYDPRT